MSRFCSAEWLAAMDATAAMAHDVPVEGRLVLQQVITAGDGDEVTWWIEIEPTGVSVQSGRADDPAVVFTQDLATAVAIHRGELNAQTAIMTGRLHLGGDVRGLLAARDALEHLDDLFAPVRAATTYEDEAGDEARSGPANGTASGAGRA